MWKNVKLSWNQTVTMKKCCFIISYIFIVCQIIVIKFGKNHVLFKIENCALIIPYEFSMVMSIRSSFSKIIPRPPED